jgi:hypothetical protein
MDIVSFMMAFGFRDNYYPRGFNLLQPVLYMNWHS